MGEGLRDLPAAVGTQCVRSHAVRIIPIPSFITHTDSIRMEVINLIHLT